MKNLHKALAQFGISSKQGSLEGKRELFQHGDSIGQFDAHEGWELVRQLSGSPVECPIEIETA